MKKNINYAKITWLTLIWLLATSFFVSITYISVVGNFSVSENATAVIPVWIWMAWIYVVPFFSSLLAFFVPIGLIIDEFQE